MEKSGKKIDNKSCFPPKNLWCVSIMSVAIIVLIWLPSFTQTWSKIVITVLGALIFARSMMINCMKKE